MKITTEVHIVTSINTNRKLVEKMIKFKQRFVGVERGLGFISLEIGFESVFFGLGLD